MLKQSTALIVIASLFLAGCGEDMQSGETKGAGFASSNAQTGSTPPPNWNATDACAVFDKAAMGEVLSQTVNETAIGNVSETDGTTAATSECTYHLADGGTATIMLRWSPIGDNSEGSINLTRNGMDQALKGFGGSVEDIDELGKAAFWAGMANSLNVFIGEDKFAIITMPAGPSAKDQAITIAHKLGA